MTYFAKEIKRVKGWTSPRLSGKVTKLIGMLIESSGPEVSLGEKCLVINKNGRKIPCQVVGFKDEQVLLMALEEMAMIAPGAEVFPTEEQFTVGVTPLLQGRVLNAYGEPIDGKGPLPFDSTLPIDSCAPQPLERERIEERASTQIKAIDLFITLGYGQRMGIFSEAGVGKSSLLGMVARNVEVDVIVVGLIGERGREVRDFIERELRESLEKSVVVVATSDMPASLRIKGAYTATTIAEYFRSLGKKVLLLIDSMTRFAMALREVGLAIGEPPALRGYPASVYAKLPTLIERAGRTKKGSITAFYTLLLEGDREDPIAEQMKSLVDGHIYLSKKLSQAHHFPPIDILQSLSRVMNEVITFEHAKKVAEARDLLQTYKEAEDLIHIGAYQEGSSPKIDLAKAKYAKIMHLLRQNKDEKVSFEKSVHYEF